jgi:hypothetical protein
MRFGAQGVSCLSLVMVKQKRSMKRKEGFETSGVVCSAVVWADLWV